MFYNVVHALHPTEQEAYNYVNPHPTYMFLGITKNPCK